MSEDTTIKVIDGKKIEVRPLDPGDLLDLFEAAGTRTVSRNWLVYASAACSIRSIDGVPLPFPKDVDAIKAVARQVGNAGMGELLAMLNDGGEAAAIDVESTKN